ncbi:MAG: nitroreductase family protein [Bacteroidales bacterium]|nr:nitroreductase family protein [Bacteroidales bacterium]
MNFYDLVTRRESIRNYNPDRLIKHEVLKRIATAGQLAPSAANRQPWRIIIVSSEKMLNAIRPCYRALWFQEAPHILIVCGDRNLSWKRSFDDYNSIETDLAIAMDHMILAAEYENIGSCWIAAFNPDILKKALNLKENEIVFALSPLGYQKDGFVKKGHKERKSFDDVVEFI